MFEHHTNNAESLDDFIHGLSTLRWVVVSPLSFSLVPVQPQQNP